MGYTEENSSTPSTVRDGWRRGPKRNCVTNQELQHRYETGRVRRHRRFLHLFQHLPVLVISRFSAFYLIVYMYYGLYLKSARDVFSTG